MIVERVERRVLCAVRFVDVTTGLPVDVPLEVRTGDDVALRRTLRGYHVTGGAPIRATPRGYYVLRTVRGLEPHEDAFAAPPDTPAVDTVPITLTVVDGRVQRYLPRRRTVRLPRATDRDSAGSLFRPVEVRLFPSPAARTSAGWAVVRASLVDDATSVPIAGALVVVRRESDNELLGRGLSDDRGEALVAVAGIPVTTWGDGAGPVLATHVDVRIEVMVDPGASQPPDPDDLETRIASLVVVPDRLALGSGVDQSLTIRCAPRP